MHLARCVGASLLVLGCWGCSAPEPQPLDPAKSEAEFRVRTLEDPGLRRYAEANGGLAPFQPASWDLAALTLVAFYYQPDLDLARARLGQARAAGVTAGMWPNPVAGLNLEKVTNAAAGIKPWIYGFNLSVPLDTLWKRGYGIEEAERQGDAALLALAEAGWRVRSRVRAALAEHLLALRELELRRLEEGARVDVVAALERKLALGDIFRLDVEVAQGELSNARVAIHSAAGRVAESRAILAAALGVPASALQGKTFSWPEIDRPPALQSLSLAAVQTAGLLNRIDLRGLLAEYAAAEAALRREAASRYPDLTLGPGLLNDQGDRKLTLGLSFTLPIFNQNEGPLAEADARRKEVAARFNQVQAAAIGDVEAASERYATALAELGETEKTLGTIDRREKAVRRAIELKELDKTALTGLRLERVQAEASRLVSLKRAQDALGALEDAVQRPLGSSAAPPLPGTTSPREEEKR
ncbi:MAG: TolC family protein [Planctomycetes bacterium]|nr:TolC family protein [Planctomycetota bacterium]